MNTGAGYYSSWNVSSVFPPVTHSHFRHLDNTYEIGYTLLLAALVAAKARATPSPPAMLIRRADVQSGQGDLRRGLRMALGLVLGLGFKAV